MLQVDWHAIEYFKQLFPWANLHSLSLSHNPWLSKDFFLSDRSWPHLRNLDLAYCRLSSEHSSSLQALFSTVPNLIALSLQGNFGLHPSLKDLLPSLKGCSRLSWLNVSGLSGTAADSQSWLQATLLLPSLSTLICHDSDLSDRVVQEFLIEVEKHTCLTHIACQNNSLPYATLFLVEALCQRQREKLRESVASLQISPSDLQDWQHRFLRAHIFSYHADAIKIFPMSIRRLYIQGACPDLGSDFSHWCQDYDLSLPLAFMYSPFFPRKLEH